MTREVMKQALEWLDRNSWPDFDKWAQEGKEVRNALRQALEQADEPHSWYSAKHDEWMTEKTRREHETLNSYTHKVGGFDLPLYTRPQPAADRATELLKRCENEMRYAGWDKFETDNTARNGVYEQVKQYLENKND